MWKRVKRCKNGLKMWEETLKLWKGSGNVGKGLRTCVKKLISQCGSYDRQNVVYSRWGRGKGIETTCVKALSTCVKAPSTPEGRCGNRLAPNRITNKDEEREGRIEEKDNNDTWGGDCGRWEGNGKWKVIKRDNDVSWRWWWWWWKSILVTGKKNEVNGEGEEIEGRWRL